MLDTKRDTWFIYFILVVSAILSLVILIDPWPGVRGPGQWRWKLLPWSEPGLVLLASGAVVLFLALWYVLGRKLPAEPTRRRLWTSLGGLVLLALMVQIGFLAVFRMNPAAILFDRSASNQANGYFQVAQEIDDLPRLLREFPEIMPTFTTSIHVRNKPPGILLIYWSARQFMDQLPWISQPIGEWIHNTSAADPWLADQSDAAMASIAMVSVLIPFLSALAILPTYGFVSRRWGSMAGWIAAGLVALIPARMVFAPQMDTAYVFTSVMALFLADTGLLRGQPAWIFGAGILLSIASFMSPVNLVVVVFIGLYIIIIHIRGRQGSIELKVLAGHLAALTAGALSIWFVYWALFGVTLLDILLATDRNLILLARSYWFWLVGNLVDLAMLSGLPALILAASWPFIKRHSKLPEAVAALAISFWTVLLLLDISGIIRGETGRIWQMLAPFPAILAGIWLVYVTFEPGISKPAHRSRTLNGGLSILISTAMISLAIGLRWHVLDLEWPIP